MISRERFAQLFIEALRALGVELPIHFDEEEFVLSIGKNPQAAEVTVNLHSPYGECENAPQNQHAVIIQRYARLHRRVAVPSDYTVAKARLGLSLSSTAFLGFHRCLNELNGVSGTAASLVHRPLTDKLAVFLVDDDGDSLQYVSEGCLSKWGVSIDTAMRDATMNLAANGCVIEQVGSVFRSQMLDSYDAARIVFIEVLSRLGVKGKPVVLAPDRDCLIITGSEDMNGLKQMAAMGHVRFEETTRLIDGRPVVLEGRRWVPFNPPEPVKRTFNQLALMHDELDYWQQSTLLRKLHKKRNDNIRIADVVRVPTGAWNQCTTMTRWENGDPALLPQVAVVSFFDRAAGTVGFAEWNDVVRIVGDRMVRTEDVPPRYRVVGFPTPAELQAMGTQMVRMVDLRQPRPRPR